MALEDAFETPEGDIESDIQLRDALRQCLETGEDRFQDNTVEVLLPFAKRLLPRARLVWIRVPNDDRSIEIGKRLALLAGDLGRKAVAVGSTDLTHYGLDYGFHPKGLGEEALRWVREENDKSIVDAFLAPDCAAAIRLGEERRAACSAGAAAAAMAFARAGQAPRPRLLGYGTSADEEASDRFVGYCSVSY
jgi:AmmeMemoRadiSam system protein B